MEDLAALKALYGLDDNSFMGIVKGYFDWLFKALQGDLGESFIYEQPVSEVIADKMVKKLIGLRIFEDENGKTNLALNDVNGSLLVISQFTLYADCRKGNRPSFTDAGVPDMANRLYEYILSKCSEQVANVQKI